jgi:hypothetical protein
MSNWAPKDIVVDGLVMALEGCGDDEDQVAIITDGGQPLRLMGVRRAGPRAETVVKEPGQ